MNAVSSGWPLWQEGEDPGSSVPLLKLASNLMAYSFCFLCIVVITLFLKGRQISVLEIEVLQRTKLAE